MVDIADLKSRGPDAAPNPKSACKQPTFSNLIISVSEHPSNTSLQLHIPSFEGIEYAAMVELVDTRDLKSRSGFQSTGSSPVSGTILLILRAVYCSENYFLGKIERIALAEDSLLFSSKWV